MRKPEVDQRGGGGRVAQVAGALLLGLAPYSGALLAVLLLLAGRKDDGARDSGPGAGPEAPRAGAALALSPAPRGRRALAGLVDFGIAGLLLLIPWVGWALAGAFLLFRDSAFDGRGVGKRLFGLAAVRADGERTLAGDPLASFSRNATIGIPILQLALVPVEAVLAAAGRPRLGDLLAGGTRVVERPGGQEQQERQQRQ